MAASFLRHPRTANELRQYYAALESGARIRAARRPKHIPTSWDDMPKGTSKSWKQNRRRKQWGR